MGATLAEPAALVIFIACSEIAISKAQHIYRRGRVIFVSVSRHVLAYLGRPASAEALIVGAVQHVLLLMAPSPHEPLLLEAVNRLPKRSFV
jgi:hypothetical protein